MRDALPFFRGLLHWLPYGFHQHEFPVLFVLLLIEATGIPLPATRPQDPQQAHPAASVAHR